VNSAQTWLIPVGQGLSEAPAWTEASLGTLELAEIERYSTEVDRQLARVSRAVGRLAATRLIRGEVTPGSWVFERTAHGGRRLRAPNGHLVHIGVADNDSMLVICADASAVPGVDIESWSPPAHWNEIAERFFARQENAALRALPLTEAATAFTLLWTAKEALAKALETPLADMLDTAVIGSEQLEVRRWLADGIACYSHEVHWFDLGTDVLATCGASRSHFAEPCTKSLADLEALSGAW
jgi:phosphopantetheinyl transferase